MSDSGTSAGTVAEQGSSKPGFQESAPSIAIDPLAPAGPKGPVRIALLGNPNTGKTTLFNRFCGLRHKTSNFPGTTQEARTGFLRADLGSPIELVDLPGVYSLELEQSEAEICRRVLAGTLAPPGRVLAAPDAVCVVIDSTNLARNLLLVGEALRRRLPTVVALNMIDLARRQHLVISPPALERLLGCEVVPCSARSGEGLVELGAALATARIANFTPPGTQEGLEDWAMQTAGAVQQTRRSARSERARAKSSGATDRLDRLFTHPMAGLAVFATVMFGLFWTIFSLAKFPMDWIDLLFKSLGGWVQAALPPGILSDFLANGVVGGVGATVIFLPQICLLFFLISLLEDTGYLARAAFVMDRWLRPFGLSGHAFVPLLSSHACALPGIMACRAIPDRRDRLATILVAPFMSCSARIPVYVLLTVVLFPGSALKQSLAFSACYVAGIVAGLLSALLARRTILRGPGRPMAMELPTYKAPSLLTALLTTYDRGLLFLKKAGTNILAIVVVLWWLSSYPQVAPPPEATQARAQAAAAAPIEQESLLAEAARLEGSHALANSFAGRIGRTIQPVFEPLGYDWQLSIGVVTSFAAREVFASTMAVIVAGTEETDETVMAKISSATRSDGVTPVFTTATSWSLLIYYVLAMQCLPTLAVTAREAGGCLLYTSPSPRD